MQKVLEQTEIYLIDNISFFVQNTKNPKPLSCQPHNFAYSPPLKQSCRSSNTIDYLTCQNRIRKAKRSPRQIFRFKPFPLFFAVSQRPPRSAKNLILHESPREVIFSRPSRTLRVWPGVGFQEVKRSRCSLSAVGLRRR